MRHYNVTITGKTPLLMHHDKIEWADQMDEWKNDPANKKGSKAGDDRSPAFRWIGSLYHDGDVIAIPQENIMRCIMEGGAMVPVPGGKNGKTFKAQTQSGMMSETPFWPLEVAGESIALSDVNALAEEVKFSAHKELVESLGFSLFVKRAKIGQSKHVRVRPRFDSWAISGSFVVWDEQLTTDVLENVLRYSGQYKGLGDWRPGGKTPGPFGMFEAQIEQI
jgi:hypothetical protein